jgi:amino-acid N-acetyltransferase
MTAFGAKAAAARHGSGRPERQTTDAATNLQIDANERERVSPATSRRRAERATASLDEALAEAGRRPVGPRKRSVQGVRGTRSPGLTVNIRRATAADADTLHALVSTHLAEGHLLPRDLAEITRHADRFVVGERNGLIHACAELAPLSASVAEVRSLVVASAVRRSGVATRLVDDLRNRARLSGFETLCAFTHDARFFVRQGFSIVPHLWIPEKITTNCLSCPLFRRCGQYAMVLPLHLATRCGAAGPDTRPVALA